MKKVFIVFVVLLIVSGLVFSQPDQFGFKKKSKQKEQKEMKESIFSAGIGYGIPYGVLGCGVEITPVEYLGFTAGIGYAIEGVGYSFGMRIYPLGKSPWTPIISAYYGVVGVILNGDTFNGGALGGGVKYRKTKYSVTAELLYLIHEKKAWFEYGSPIKISGGFLWHL